MEMSVESWKEEFYSEPANEVPASRAARHSLKKWQGALPANLEKHDVAYTNSYVHDRAGGEVIFGAASCALCQAFERCQDCTLAKVRGGTSCDDPLAGEDYLSESTYRKAANAKGVPRMIYWLEKAVELEVKLEGKSGE
jgi:hypothetical protein